MKHVLLTALLLPACFRPHPADGLIACSASGACPSDYYCAEDRTCWRNGHTRDAGLGDLAPADPSLGDLADLGAADLSQPRRDFAGIDLAGADLAPPGGFVYRRAITVDRAQVGLPAGPPSLTDYPLLVVAADATLKDTAHGGHVASALGYDIVIGALDPALCGGQPSCTLKHELDAYSPTAGTLTAWVRVPALNSNLAATNTVIYLYYGNPGVAAPTENRAAVWDANFKGVWHLDGNPAGTAPQAPDVTSGANNGSAGGTWTAAQQLPGKIGGSFSFNGTDNYVDVADNASLNFAAAADFTVSLWVLSTQLPMLAIFPRLVSKGNDTAPKQGYNLIFHQPAAGGTTPWYGETYSNAVQATAFGTDVANGAWRFLVLVRQGAQLMTYQDGALVQNNGGAGGTLINTLQLRFGAMALTGGQFYAGREDEVRISSVARSASWILTDFNNQFSPATFAVVGAETLNQ